MKYLSQEALEDDSGVLQLAFSEVTEMIDYRCCGRFPAFVEVIEDNGTKKNNLLVAYRNMRDTHVMTVLPTPAFNQMSKSTSEEKSILPTFAMTPQKG